MQLFNETFAITVGLVQAEIFTPLYSVFCDFLYASDSFEYISNVVDSPLLDIESLGRVLQIDLFMTWIRE